MNERIGFKTIWHSAAIPGLVLAAVSTSYLLISQGLASHPGILTSVASGVLASVASTLLNIVKIVACIWLMKYYMTRFHKEEHGSDTKDLKRFGTMVALLSALVFSACSMAYYMWNPEIISEAIDTIMQSSGQALDRNAMNALDNIKENAPRIIFFSQLLYCFLFGWILSGILAPRIANPNPFAEDKDILE